MMKITPTLIKIRDIYNGYNNDPQGGCVAYGGKLNIRPPYQREFIYNDEQQRAVIDTVYKGFPLNSMYWALNDDGTYEVIDGQQRTISFCEFCEGNFSTILENSLNYFGNFSDTIQNRILDYECTVYICEGNEQEKLDWFRVINIASVKLSDQELRNAVYTGTWLTDAKKYFSKPNCGAYKEGKDYISGDLIRQEYLQTAIDWISERDGLVSDKTSNRIEKYMALHQNDANANELWLYFKTVLDWVKILFPKYRKEMKGIPWGTLYNQYHKNSYDAKTLEKRISELMADDEVTKKKGIYLYLFDGEESNLSLRKFTDTEKRTMYEKQLGICPMCHNRYEFEEMHADHIIPWSKGGKTTLDNGQMLCRDCNLKKSNH